MSNPKQLPPELVENIGQIKYKSGFGDTYTVLETIGSIGVKQCAKIAADYAEEENSELVECIISTLDELQKERNNHYQMAENFLDTGNKHLSKQYRLQQNAMEMSRLILYNKSQKLLKNHEDGK